MPSLIHADHCIKTGWELCGGARTRPYVPGTYNFPRAQPDHNPPRRSRPDNLYDASPPGDTPSKHGVLTEQLLDGSPPRNLADHGTVCLRHTS